MPSDAAQRTFPPFIRWTLITNALIIGAGYAFGPEVWYSSTSFDVLKGIPWFPIPAWGFSFMFAGMLMMGTKLVGYALSLVLWSTWGLGLMVTAVDGHLQGWGAAVWPFFGAAVCAYEVNRWGQRRLTRRQARER